MLSFTDLVNRTADMCGIDPTQDTQDMANIAQDINQGRAIFANTTSRYWTRKQASAGLVANQQYYTLPPDATRVTEIFVNANGLNYPVKQVQSEAIWNKINIIPAITINVPTYYWIRGRNELGLWPIPSYTQSNSLNISYEPQQHLSINDITSANTSSTATVSNGSTTVSFSQNIIQPWMVGMWFHITGRYQESWYRISIFDSTNQVELDNIYAGIGGGNLSFRICDMPDFPGDFHIGLVYYAASNFYLKRTQVMYAKELYSKFEDLRLLYKEAYASKTTGIVQGDTSKQRWSIFMIPPPPITA
jgi:hypothetical protein